MEDPITFIKGAGCVSVENKDAYSYVYDEGMGTLTVFSLILAWQVKLLRQLFGTTMKMNLMSLVSGLCIF